MGRTAGFGAGASVVTDCQVQGIRQADPRAEAGRVRRTGDDGTTGAGPAYAACRSASGEGLGVTFPCSHFPQVAVYGLIFYFVPLTLKHRLCRRNQFCFYESVVWKIH